MLAWLVIAHWIVPSISIISEIRKTASNENPSGYKYRINICNQGRRDAVDLEFFAKLRIQGLINGEPKIWRAIYIPVDDPRIPKMKSNRKKKSHMSVQLLVNSLSSYARDCLPKHLQKQLDERKLLLEDLMKLGKNARLQVAVFGYDSFSGARKLFESSELDEAFIKEY
jgi:hypothetical protein